MVVDSMGRATAEDQRKLPFRSRLATAKTFENAPLP